ncbi:hypothetical protein GCM10010924_37970 [Rhizobium wenxiniae]|uniref:Uncharacterized protein n=1 Tax=Rhizobium wenxiniae TaxID=1737357 RepID=A0A7W9YA13_9HYPH|nr:hypothetical protein [Rhizobium wenxiniae]GGG05748.1 hypothetical protein GCM10010924_37970 [Rhizobium wenxiniae]
MTAELTARGFWIAAVIIAIGKDVVIAAAKVKRLIASIER